MLLENRWYFNATLGELQELRHVAQVRSVLLLAKCTASEDLRSLVEQADWSFTLEAMDVHRRR